MRHFDWPGLILLVLVAVLLGFILGYLVGQWEALQFNGQVSASDLFGAFCALIIALTIGYVLEKRSGERRIEKDAIIGDVDSVVKHVKDARRVASACVGGEEQATAVFEAFKKASAATAALEERLKTYDLYRSRVKKQFVEVERALRDYRTLVDSEILPSKSGMYSADECKRFQELINALHFLGRCINRA